MTYELSFIFKNIHTLELKCEPNIKMSQINKT